MQQVEIKLLGTLLHCQKSVFNFDHLFTGHFLRIYAKALITSTIIVIRHARVI